MIKTENRFTHAAITRIMEAASTDLDTLGTATVRTLDLCHLIEELRRRQDVIDKLYEELQESV